MSNHVRCSAFLLALLVTGLASPDANAVILYQWEGPCGNGCTGTASGTLTLQDTYTPGSVLTDADFISFSYTSSSGSYSIPADAALSGIAGGGSLPAVSGLVDTDIAMDWERANTVHVTMPGGGWASTFDSPSIIDGGDSYVWTLPEPATTVLLAIGVVGLLLAGRWQARPRVAARAPVRVRSR